MKISLLLLTCYIAVIPGNRSVLSQAVVEPRTLILGQPVEDRMDSGQSHEYRVAVAAGEFIRIEIEQRGVDIAVKLIGPRANQLLEVDSPGGPYGPECVSWIAEEAGDYRVIVSTVGKPWPPKEYWATLVEK